MAGKRKSGWLIWALALIALWLALESWPADPGPARWPGAAADEAGELTVWFIDVGQGDAILLSQDGCYMLVDAGPDSAGQALRQFLRERDVTSLDYLALTHPHEDHIGRVPEALAQAPAKTVYLPSAVHTTVAYEDMLDAVESCGAAVKIARSGQSFSLGQAQVEILGPAEEYEGLNDNSLVLRISFGDTALLLTGDAGVEAEADILAAGYAIRADILKVSHHGSNSSTSRDWLEAVSPEIAVISCGAGNDYGHPHREVLERLEEAGVEIYRTDQSGTIKAVSDGQSFTLTTER